MSEWLTAREIASRKLPGLPFSKRKVNDFAVRNGWHQAKSEVGEALARPRQGRGGGFEFHVSLLPAVSRTRLEAKLGRERAEAEIAKDIDLLTPKSVSRRDARLFVLARADEWARAHPDLNRGQADDAYAAALTAGTAEVPAWVQRLVGATSGRTLRRWRQARDQGRMDLVAGRHSVRKGSRDIERLKNGEIATFIGALIVKQPMITCNQVMTMVRGKYEGTIELPSERTVQRFIASWKADNRLVLMKLTNPDQFRSSSRLAGSNSFAHVRALNELWQIDASPADVMTTDGRHAIYVTIDIWSRRMMVLVTKTPRTEATLALVRRAVMAWGVPQAIKTDNGSDFTSQRFVAAMTSLGIVHEMSDAFSPEQKGHVERAIGTMQRDLMRLLPGFIGHSVADRKVIEERKAFSQRLGEDERDVFSVDISAVELQEIADEWCENRYAHTPHAGLDNETPFTKASSFTGEIRRIENERALDLLLAPIPGGGWRQATKQGIRIDAAHFISPLLLPGTRYYCRHDPLDFGLVQVFESEAGAFVTTAVCPERGGIDPRAVVAAAREKQADLIAERAREVRSEAKKIKPRDMVDWMRADGRAQASKFAAFPKRSSRYSSPALDAAAAAVSDGRMTLAPATAEHLPKLSAAGGTVHRLPETPRQRFDRARKIEQALAAGDAVTADEALWLGKYQTLPEYRSFKVLEQPRTVLEKS